MKKIKGFSLIELLVTMGIITMLSSISLSYSRIGENQLILAKEEARVFNFLIRAKVLSIETFGESGSPCGYGVHFEGDSAILFKETSPTNDPQCADINYAYDSAEKFDQLRLDSAVSFSYLGFHDLVFIPPQPLAVIDADPNKTEASIRIKAIGGVNEKTITITNSGQITD